MAKNRTIVHLECETCGIKNYSKRVSKKRAFGKLSLSKFCARCRRHAQHKETKQLGVGQQLQSVEQRTPNPPVGGSNPSWPATSFQQEKALTMNKIIAFIREVKAEIKKVSWPSRDELVGSTIIVCILVLIVAVILGIMDSVFSYFIKQLIG